VALVIRVGYFCTAGHTEAGGIDRFLKRIDSGEDVDWVRCFPAIRKPGPKLGRATPKHRAGLTGPGLVGEMLERLAEYHRPKHPTNKGDPLDVVVFIDDADCRFEGDPAKLEAWSAARSADVRAAIGDPSTPFVALFASPEVEAWFVADWEQGFGFEHRRLSSKEKHFRAHMEELLGAVASIESYGGGLVNGSCANKLSEKLHGLVTRLGGSYSKGMHGQEMLLRIRPEKVAEVCKMFFRPGLQALLRAIAAARSDAARAEAARRQA
jgi:hypothetical protein